MGELIHFDFTRLPFPPEALDGVLRGEKSPPIPWIIRRLIPQDSLLQWAADPGVGKSFLALDLCLSVVSGQQFLNFPCARQGSVVYFDEENPQHVLAERIFYLGRGREITTLDGDFFVFRLKMRGRHITDWLKDAVSIVSCVQPVLVIFDTFLKFSGGPKLNKENDSSIMQAVCDALQIVRCASAPKASALFLHHLTKNRKHKTARGSGVIVGDPDGIWTLTHSAGKPPPDSVMRATRLSPDKSRPIEGAPKVSISVTRRHNGLFLVGKS